MMAHLWTLKSPTTRSARVALALTMVALVWELHARSVQGIRADVWSVAATAGVFGVVVFGLARAIVMPRIIRATESRMMRVRDLLWIAAAAVPVLGYFIFR